MSAGWKWAVAGLVAAGMVGCLGAALWLGGGPGTREGWEAASWAAGVLAALGLAVSTAWWVLRRPGPAPVPSGQDHTPLDAPAPAAASGSGQHGAPQPSGSRIEGGATVHRGPPGPGSAGPPVLDAQGTPAELVGREDILDELLAVLDPTAGQDGEGVVVSSSATASVAGMGGIGKTALAQTAADAVRQKGWFGGVLWVDLHGYTPGTQPRTAEQALDLLLRDLRVPDHDIPPEPERKQARYRAALSACAQELGGPLLVVADNAAEAGQVEALRPGIGGHRLLITSRERLAALTGARLLRLEFLSAAAARELLERLVRTAEPTDARLAAPEALGELADACGGLPLAVHIAAALLIADPGADPAELAARLTEGEGRLERFDDGHRRLGVVLEESCARQPAEQRELFGLLGAAPGRRASTKAAAVLIGRTEEQAHALLLGLERAHLAVREAGLWTMHDLVADHAQSLARAAENDPEQAQAQRDALVRLLDHYTATTQAADAHLRALPGQEAPERFTGREEAMAWLDTHREILVAAVHTAQEMDNTSTAIHLPLALGPYMDWRRAFIDLITVTTIARDTSAHTGDTHREAAAWNNLGLALRQVRRVDESLDALTRARTLFQQTGDTHGQAQAWHGLGLALQGMERIHDAIDAHTHARNHYQQTGDTHGQAQAWHGLGLALLQVHRFDESLDAQTRARTLFQQTGDTHGEAQAWFGLGLALQGMERIHDAIDAQTHARTLFQQTGDTHGEAGAWQGLGDALRASRRHGEAATAVERAVALCAETGDEHWQAIAQDLLTEILDEQGDSGNA